MKLKEIATITKNSTTKQVSLVLKARQLKKKKITPEELLEMTVPKSNVKFYKKD